MWFKMRGRRVWVLFLSSINGFLHFVLSRQILLCSSFYLDIQLSHEIFFSWLWWNHHILVFLLSLFHLSLTFLFIDLFLSPFLELFFVPAPSQLYLLSHNFNSPILWWFPNLSLQLTTPWWAPDPDSCTYLKLSICNNNSFSPHSNLPSSSVLVIQF